jgi:hypothetical protein
MVSGVELGWSDRIAFSFVGAVTGALYGIPIVLLVYFFTDHVHFSLVGWSAVVFGALGIFYRNLIGEAFLAILHFLVGVYAALSEQPSAVKTIAKGSPDVHLRAFLLVGFGTGLVLALWICS